MQIEIRGAERLSFRERQVVALRESGFANQDVAKRLKISAGTVATLFNRAKRKGYQVVIVLDGDPLALFDPDDERSAEELRAGNDTRSEMDQEDRVEESDDTEAEA